MLVFLAYAGTRAGQGVGAALASGSAWRIVLLGFIVTTVLAVSLLAASRWAGVGWLQASGQLAGAQTQPAALAFAQVRVDFDNRVSLGYALVYPAAMVAKIVAAQLLVALG
jgi:putative transport protein